MDCIEFLRARSCRRSLKRVFFILTLIWASSFVFSVSDGWAQQSRLRVSRGLELNQQAPKQGLSSSSRPSNYNVVNKEQPSGFSISGSSAPSTGVNRQVTKTRGNSEYGGVGSSKTKSSLVSDSGKYDFLRLVPVDRLDSLKIPDDGVLVAIPRRNFLLQDDSKNSLSESNEVGVAKEFQKSEVSSSIPIVQNDVVRTSSARKDDSEFRDEYIVFTLRNLDYDERLLLLDSQNGVWDFADLLSASLIAEGLTSRESRVHYRSRFETLLLTLKSRTNGMTDELMKTQIAYDFLHREALVSKYDLNCSSVAAALDKGVFNCVSATVLFNCFASRIGLEVAALETTGHAKSRVKYDESYLDIETTCSSWDRLPDRIRPYTKPRVNRSKAVTTEGALAQVTGASTERVFDAQRQVIRGFVDETDALVVNDEEKREQRVVTGKVYFKPVQFDDEPAGNDVSLENVSLQTEPRNNDGSNLRATDSIVTDEGSTTFGLDAEAPLGYSFTRTRRPMREITDVELVATIYYNVGVDNYQNGNYEGAVTSYIKAAQLAPNNRTVLGNLKATLNNWAIDVATREKRYADAIRITQLGLTIDPDFREFKMNMPIFFHDWIDHLAMDDKWDDVAKVQALYKQMFPEEYR